MFKNGLLAVAGILALGTTGVWYARTGSRYASEPELPAQAALPLAQPAVAVTAGEGRGFDEPLVPPLSDALLRVTKKPFGLRVTPETSPVQPDIFDGFHTGVDFEVFEHEFESVVPVMAVCSGRLLLKKWVPGYGGVAVQECVLAREHVTVIYGHLKLDSITPVPGARVAAGQVIGVLGQGQTEETDGRRKHLHLGIHKGTSFDVRGYVKDSSLLVEWIDVLNYLK